MKITALTRTQDAKIEKQAQTTRVIHEPEDIASYVDAIKLAAREDNLSKEALVKISRLPARSYILKKMSPTELSILFENVSDLWKIITGEKLPVQEGIDSPKEAKDVDGNFWLLPGGVMIKGFNHFSTAVRHKNMLCNLLDINPFIFEEKMHRNPSELVRMIIYHGGIRMNIDREASKVIAQTNEESWPTLLSKFQKMYHKHKVARVLDPAAPYKGWKSGVPIIVNG